MSIRIRRVNGVLVALCAAKTSEEPGDIYLDDNAHHALTVKFERDFFSEGMRGGTPNRGGPEWLEIDRIEGPWKPSRQPA